MTSTASAARRLIAAAALGCSAAVVAACGTSASTAGSPAATAPAATTPATTATSSRPASSPAPTPAASTSGPPPCATSALRAAVPTGAGNAAAGSSYYPIQFDNVSGAPCTLYGYPGVSFVTEAGGSQIGPAAARNPALAPQLVSLSPGQTVHAELGVVDAQNYPPADCGFVTAHWLRVYPPGQTAPLYVSFTTQTCSQPRQILSVQAVQPGADGP